MVYWLHTGLKVLLTMPGIKRYMKLTSLEYRSGNEDCVRMRHVLYIQCLYRHSAGRPVLSIIVLWQSGVNVLFIRPSDVTNSEHKLHKLSNFLTFYFRILVWNEIWMSGVLFAGIEYLHRTRERSSME